MPIRLQRCATARSDRYGLTPAARQYHVQGQKKAMKGGERHSRRSTGGKLTEGSASGTRWLEEQAGTTIKRQSFVELDPAPRHDDYHRQRRARLSGGVTGCDLRQSPAAPSARASLSSTNGDDQTGTCFALRPILGSAKLRSVSHQCGRKTSVARSSLIVQRKTARTLGYFGRIFPAKYPQTTGRRRAEIVHVVDIKSAPPLMGGRGRGRGMTPILSRR